MATLTAIGTILFFAGFIQGMTGFGSALVALPLLCLIVDIKFAIPLSVLSSLGITLLLALKLKAHLDKSKLIPLCTAALPGIFVGVTLLKKVNSETIALLLGILIIGYSCYSLFLNPTPKKLHPRWGYAAGFFSGAIGSAFSAGGPPVIIYTTMTGWDKDSIKATMTGFFLFNSLMIALAHGMTGVTTTEVMQTFLITFPLVILGTAVGSYCYGFLHKTSYLKIIYIFLIIMGVMMITLKS